MFWVFLFLLFSGLVVANGNSTVTTTPLPSSSSSSISSEDTTTLSSITNNPPKNISSVDKPTVGEANIRTAQSPFLTFFFGKNAIGSKCASTDDCKIKEAFCVNGTCQCSPEYVATSNKMACLIRAKNLLDTCVDSIQCEAGLQDVGRVACIAFQCICALDSHLVQGKCYKRLELGQSCQTNEECSVPYSSCRENVCACIDNMEPDEENADCVAMRSIDAAQSNCTDDRACSIFGYQYKCNNGTCGCRPGYYFSGAQCVREKRLGDYCDINSDCIVEEQREKTGLRECKKNVCSCIKGYKGDEKVNMCKSGASSVSSSLLQLSFIFLFYLFYQS